MYAGVRSAFVRRRICLRRGVGVDADRLCCLHHTIWSCYDHVVSCAISYDRGMSGNNELGKLLAVDAGLVLFVEC